MVAVARWRKSNNKFLLVFDIEVGEGQIDYSNTIRFITTTHVDFEAIMIQRFQTALIPSLTTIQIDNELKLMDSWE